MQLQDLSRMAQNFKTTNRMPALFVGHGSPMNAIEENKFTKNWNSIGKALPTPNAILCISAHWLTRGTHITSMEFPKTIHDFGGFPQALFDVEYPAKGSPSFAKETRDLIHFVDIDLDDDWGLDHGAWSVIKHIYPNADVPVLQLSIDYSKPPQYHYDLARELQQLRNKGVLIIGSGNIVHNLRMVDWRNIDGGYDWAEEANEKIMNLIQNGNHKALIDYKNLGAAVDLAVPTADHYLPLLYTLGTKASNDETLFFNETNTLGSIAMTSLIYS